MAIEDPGALELLGLVQFGRIGLEQGPIRWIKMDCFQSGYAPDWLFVCIWPGIDLDPIPILPSHFGPESIPTSGGPE
jgi:hypothetical protein